MSDIWPRHAEVVEIRSGSGTLAVWRVWTGEVGSQRQFFAGAEVELKARLFELGFDHIVFDGTSNVPRREVQMGLRLAEAGLAPAPTVSKDAVCGCGAPIGGTAGNPMRDFFSSKTSHKILGWE